MSEKTLKEASQKIEAMKVIRDYYTKVLKNFDRPHEDFLSQVLKETGYSRATFFRRKREFDKWWKE
jgi:hypothetical protein